jgi:hypothetical protein
MRSLAMALLPLLVATASVQAQSGGGHSGRQRNQQQTPQPTQQQSSIPTLPTPVPGQAAQLDVGAILCQSRDDLVNYQQQIDAGAGATTAELATDCHPVPTQTGIEILDRDGPSRTEIVTTDTAKRTGWTNTYLP